MAPSLTLALTEGTLSKLVVAVSSSEIEDSFGNVSHWAPQVLHSTNPQLHLAGHHNLTLGLTGSLRKSKASKSQPQTTRRLREGEMLETELDHELCHYRMFYLSACWYDVIFSCVSGISLWCIYPSGSHYPVSYSLRSTILSPCVEKAYKYGSSKSIYMYLACL